MVAGSVSTETASSAAESPSTKAVEARSRDVRKVSKLVTELLLLIWSVRSLQVAAQPASRSHLLTGLREATALGLVRHAGHCGWSAIPGSPIPVRLARVSSWPVLVDRRVSPRRRHNV